MPGSLTLCQYKICIWGCISFAELCECSGAKETEASIYTDHSYSKLLIYHLLSLYHLHAAAGLHRSMMLKILITVLSAAVIVCKEKFLRSLFVVRALSACDQQHQDLRSQVSMHVRLDCSTHLMISWQCVYFYVC